MSRDKNIIEDAIMKCTYNPDAINCYCTKCHKRYARPIDSLIASCPYCNNKNHVHDAAPLNGWISVGLDLPDYGQDVLLLFQNGTGTDRWIKIGHRVSTDINGQHYSTDHSHKVTHWQPLPGQETDDDEHS